MLDLQHPLIVTPLLLPLIGMEALFEVLANVSLCEWVENPNIKKCILTCLPETSSAYIQTSFIPNNSTATPELLPCQGLQRWFNGYIFTHSFEHQGDDIPELVVP